MKESEKLSATFSIPGDVPALLVDALLHGGGEFFSRLTRALVEQYRLRAALLRIRFAQRTVCEFYLSERNDPVIEQRLLSVANDEQPDHFDSESGRYLSFQLSSEDIIQLKRDESFNGTLVVLTDSLEEISINEADIRLVDELIAVWLRANDPRVTGLGMFAHNIKHYLMLIEELIKVFESGSPERRDFVLGKVKKVLKQVLLETTSILLLSKGETGHLQFSPISLGLNDLLQDCIGEMAPLFKSKDISIVTELTDNLPEIEVDPAIFPSVIANLLDNALKYSVNGGQVEIRTFVADGGSICLEITDHGLGIPLEEQPLIFSLGFRASNVIEQAGYGLGLYLVRSVVEAHHGQVSFVSEPGKGTTFRLRIPKRGK